MSNEGTRLASEETSDLDETQRIPAIAGRPLIGDQAEIALPGYLLLSVLGQGGMGTVFLALQQRLQRHVAVKMLHPGIAANQLLNERLEREAKTLANLSHPNIVACHDIVHSDGNTFVIMEYVPGRLSVRDIIRRLGAVPEALAVKIVREAAYGLAYAHEKGIVHRDIKPDNLLLVCEDEITEDDPALLFSQVSSRVMIVDFGIAKGEAMFEGSPEVTREGMIMGSPAYMAPEQALNTKSVDFRADIYALGATLYHMLSGETPFDSDSPLSSVRKKMEQDLPDPRKAGANVSVQCMALLRTMTARAPEDRHGSYASLISALDHLVSLHDSSGAGKAGPSYAWPRRTFAYIAAAALCLAGAGSYVLFQTLKSRSERALSSVPAAWADIPPGWRIDVLDDESREIGIINTGSDDLLQLERELTPRANIMMRVRLPTLGWLTISLRDNHKEIWRLNWERQGDGQKWQRSLPGNSASLTGIVNKEIYDWHQMSFQVHPTQVILWINGQLTDIAPVVPSVTTFQLALASAAGRHAQFAGLEVVELPFTRAE